MRISAYIPVAAALLTCATACHGVDEYAADPRGTFEALWHTVDEHYCFFADKDVDWDAVYAQYSPHVSDEMNSYELFDICSQMLDELRDGHVNLSSP